MSFKRFKPALRSFKHELGTVPVLKYWPRRAKGVTVPHERMYIIGDTPHDAEAAAHIDSRMKRILVATGNFSFNELFNRKWGSGTKPDLMLTSLSQLMRHHLIAPLLK